MGTQPAIIVVLMSVNFPVCDSDIIRISKSLAVIPEQNRTEIIF